jgi:hypothetical protein
MIFLKRHFAAACLLLGTSGLLVSCNETLPDEAPEPELVADTAGCIAVDAGSSEIHKSASQKRPSDVQTADIDTADCIKDGL